MECNMKHFGHIEINQSKRNEEDRLKYPQTFAPFTNWKNVQVGMLQYIFNEFE